MLEESAVSAHSSGPAQPDRTAREQGRKTSRVSSMKKGREMKFPITDVFRSWRCRLSTEVVTVASRGRCSASFACTMRISKFDARGGGH